MYRNLAMLTILANRVLSVGSLHTSRLVNWFDADTNTRAQPYKHTN